ncbi:MAG: ATP-binding protein [Gemmatimonadetes bacterium]|nr:ATP-binding protein [Gemmatimonadota bacterium]
MANPETDDLQITIPSSYDAMEKVAAMIEEAGDRVGITEDDEVDLMISVMEAVNNAIQHGNKEDASKNVHIKIEATPGQLNCWVRDEGEGFDPARVPDPLRPDNLLNPSGRGILMMREFMDQVEFSAGKEGTSVKMSKMFTVSGQGA